MAANKCFSRSGRDTVKPHWRATVAYWAATGDEGLKSVPKASKQRRRLGLGSRGIVAMRCDGGAGGGEVEVGVGEMRRSAI